MLKLILAAQLIASNGASDGVEEIRVDDKQGAIRLNSLALPDEVSPAVFPYVLCLQSAAGIPMYGPDGELANSPDKPSDCAGVRSKALVDGVKMLERQNLMDNSTGRTRYVESVLADIDEFARPRTEEELQEAYAQEPVTLDD